MFYALSKIAWTFARPSSAIALVIALGIVLAWFRPASRWGLRFATAGSIALLIAGFSPLANNLLLPLEQRFPVPDLAANARSIAGVIVLGGGEDGRVGRARGQLTLNEPAERITAAVTIARALPHVRIHFAGGAAGVVMEDLPAGAQIAAFWRDAGIASERITYEEQSLTTFENAVVAKRLLAPKSGDQFLLVTSAMHMPRAIATFRAADFQVLAYPVDYRTKDEGDRLRPFQNVARGLARTDDATREWLGLLGYRLLGRSQVLFPAP